MFSCRLWIIRAERPVGKKRKPAINSSDSHPTRFSTTRTGYRAILLLLPWWIGCGGQTAEPLSDARPTSASKNAAPADATSVIAGRVIADGQPIAGARVRWQARPESCITDAEGRFELPDLSSVTPARRVTASKVGFFIAGTDVPVPRDSATQLELTLQPLPDQDHAAYDWIDPTPDEHSPKNCGNCHPLIYQEWLADGHARSATNPRFLSLYDGTNWQGEPDVSWGLLPDYPDAAGICTTCHAPAANLDDLAVGNIRQVEGVARRGVHCDFCHKIQDVTRATVGLTHGRFGVQLLRPESGSLSFGPLDDVDVGTDSHLPLQSESLFCATCHEGIVFGVPVYTTYSEWLESPDRGTRTNLPKLPHASHGQNDKYGAACRRDRARSTDAGDPFVPARGRVGVDVARLPGTVP